MPGLGQGLNCLEERPIIGSSTLPQELERRLPDTSMVLEKDWSLAIFRTNEHPPSRPLLEKVRTQFEHGYLIGLGSGNLWSHLLAFPNSEPMGVISIDASEFVVAGLRLLREFLILYPGRKEFLKGMRNFLEGEVPVVSPYSLNLRAYFNYFVYWKSDDPFWVKERTSGRINYDPLYHPKVALHDWDSNRMKLKENPAARPDIPGFILQNYENLRKLAIEGRVGVIQ